MTPTIRKSCAKEKRREKVSYGPVSTWIRRGLGLVILGSLAQGHIANAETITAASCSASAVQTALGKAASGDIVRIPAGTCSWTSTISWSAPPNVAVFGAGNLNTQGGGDRTVIVDDVSGGKPLMTITPNSSGTFRLSGITVQGGSGSIKEEGLIKLLGSSTKVRLSHIHIDKSTYRTGNSGKFIYVGGTLRGVIDNALFTSGTNIGWVHFVNGQVGSGDGPWAEPTGFGTSDFFFIEDSRIVSRRSGSSPPLGTLTDCHTGGKFVVRYTEALNTNIGQTHPTGHGSDDRGCRAYELYGITSTSDRTSNDEPNFAFSYNNSGTALNWGNSVGGVYKNILYFNICRTGTSCGYNPPYGGWGVCGQSSAWDKNSDSSGYPCVDQPGRGQGDRITGVFPNKTNAALGRVAWPRQELEPVYEWLTTGSTASGWGGGWVNNGSPAQIKNNRDFFTHHNNNGCDPGAATCASGVGVGTIAQRPSNCALNTAWWATDAGGNWNKANAKSNDGALYKCTSTNNWTLYYTPYAYPHPLRQDEFPAPPEAPSDIRVDS